jgi:tetratricopeptide (TPR) repeat protein
MIARVLFLFLLLMPVRVVAAEGEPSPRTVLLDELLGQLAASKTPEEGKPIERAIENVWLASGSPSIDLLMARGMDALREGDHDRAYFYFDEVVTLAPGFAEGWDKRAAIHYIREDYGDALRDIENVLRLEPRHFGALAGLGVILEELGDRKGALDAYRRALALNPWIENLPERMLPLELDIDGRGI